MKKNELKYLKNEELKSDFDQLIRGLEDSRDLDISSLKMAESLVNIHEKLTELTSLVGASYLPREIGKRIWTAD